MHHRPLLLTHHLVRLVHHIKQLIAPLRIVLQRMIIIGPRHLHPVQHRQLLRPRRLDAAHLRRHLRPVPTLRHRLAQLLPPLRKSPPHQFVKEAHVIDRQIPLSRLHQHHRRVDRRPRMKQLRRDRLQRLARPLTLHPQTQHPVGLRPRHRHDAVDHLLLQHDHRPRHRRRRTQKIPQNRPTRRVGQVPQKLHGPLLVQPADVKLRPVLMQHLHRVIVRIPRRQPHRQTLVELHQNHLPHLPPHLLGQRPRPRPHLHHTVIRLQLQLLHNPRRRVLITQKILPQPLRGHHLRLRQRHFHFRQCHRVPPAPGTPPTTPRPTPIHQPNLPCSSLDLGHSLPAPA